ncbi:hypothetical protein NE237_006824 [Protea cynaroides]|uniref:Bacterial Ig-like domain-containing protein n=1 Tax=Protea cynaroides TaxID=273540 RepID=A0A9Q0QVU8_9MAGN|nr:hypothetical protein NE237_006824 [Protea cynaroides]
MGLAALLLLDFLSFFFLLCCLGVHSGSSEFSVNFLDAPPEFSPLTSATFVFEVLEGQNGDICRNCCIKCKLDDQISSDCEAKKASYRGLRDGGHFFEVCVNGTQGASCASYNWTVDTVHPTADVTATTSFTNALNVTVNISFSEPCIGGGGFGCLSVNTCNLLVYGAGRVIPSTFKILQPDLKFSLLVGLSSSVNYGRIIGVMDKNFCTDSAGNLFTRTANSSFFVHFDRRNVFLNLRTRIPEQLLQINGDTRTVEATNNSKNLKVYLYFSDPVLNSSAEILTSLQTSQGLLLPTNGMSLGNRRFGFLVKNISSVAIVTISFNSSTIISRHGTPISSIAPVTFLYDCQRPSVRLTTTSNTRTREHNASVLIKFAKPVFGFNSSAVSISGGHLQSFQEISRSTYTVLIHATDNYVSIHVAENITGDVAGNRNLASNMLQVRQYSVPSVSSAFSIFAVTAFAVTASASGLLTLSTASLQSIGALSDLSSSTSDPARNLFRITCHIQVFALSRWLAVAVPVEYYEFARGLEWTIPYLSLPWESGRLQSVIVGSNLPAMTHSVMLENDKGTDKNVRSPNGDLDMSASIFGLPLTPMEYRSYFESQNIKPEGDDILDHKNSNGWREFNRNIFWLAVIGGSLILLHAIVLFILRLRKKSSEKQGSYGVLIFPRFEIFLMLLALPCVCQASAAVIKGGTTSGVIVGVLLLGVESFLLLALLLFLSAGITLGKLLQYKEVHQEGQQFHWYQEIVRVTLGPGKRGQWTWKNQLNSIYPTMLGPLFEDLRGPPKYMLTQISGGNPKKQGERIIASDDETEDAEAPFIQKLFGILRIYYTFFETVKRFALGIVVGASSVDTTSRAPALTLLCISSFQLFFIVLKKPFIKKKVQLVEILTIASEVGIFSICVVLSEKEFSSRDETRIGIFMLLLFLIGFSVQMINEWYALYRQTLQLSPANSFLSGLRTAGVGLLLILIPCNHVKNLDNEFPLNQSGNEERESSVTFGDQNRSSGSKSSGTPDRPWMKQLRAMAKASFSKEEQRDPKDPSTSQTQGSGFWSGKRSGSSSMTSSADFKPRKSRSLYKDLEAIFSSK